MEEIWKPIPHYEGIYEASNFGRIRTAEGKVTYSKRFNCERHWAQRILKYRGSTYKTGYRVSLWKDGKPKDWLVARLVAMTFLGESDLTVNHIDGNRFNNHIENLEWCSLSENIKKGFETGLYKKSQKKTALKNLKTGEIIKFNSMSEINSFLGVNHSFVSDRIKQNKLIIGDYEIIPHQD